MILFSVMSDVCYCQLEDTLDNGDKRTVTEEIEEEENMTTICS